MCPDSFPLGFYWYGNRKHGPGCPLKKIQRNLIRINAALGQPPMRDNNPESKASTGNIIGDNNKSNWKAKHPVYHRYNLRNWKRQTA